MRIANLDSGNPVVMSNANGISFGSISDSITASINIISAFSAGAVVGGAPRLVFSNVNNVSWGFSTSAGGTTLTASTSAGAGGGIVPAYSAGTQSVSTGTLVLSNSNNVTFGMAGSSQVTISTAGPTLKYFNNMFFAPRGLAAGQNTLFVAPLAFGVFPGLMTVSTVIMPIQIGNTAFTTNQSCSYTTKVGIYSLNASTLSLLNSFSTSYSIVGTAASLHASALSWLTVHSSAWSSSPSFSQTNYWVAYVSSSNGNSDYGIRPGIMLVGDTNGRHGTFGVNGGASSSPPAVMPFLGQYSVTTAGLPATIGTGDLIASVGTGVFGMIFDNVFGGF